MQRTWAMIGLVSAAAVIVGLFGDGSPAAAQERHAVLIRLGLQDKEPAKWDGEISVTPGSVERLEGWLFARGDKVLDTSGWVARTRKRQVPRRGRVGPVEANGIVVNLTAPASATVKVKLPPGELSFALRDLQYGKATKFLGGAVDIAPVLPTVRLTQTETEDDFAAAAVGSDGTVWVAYISYQNTVPEAERVKRFQEEPENFDMLGVPAPGDRLNLIKVVNGKASEPIPVTEPGQDLYRPAVACDGDGRTWVLWSANTDGNLDLYARSFDQGGWSAALRLTEDPGPDLNVVATTDSGGRVVLAWQAFRKGQSDIRMMTIADGAPGKEVVVSADPANEWAPAVAAGPGGEVAIAWDSYRKGDYDVFLRRRSGRGKLSKVVGVATTAEYEARPSVAYDAQGRIWVAWEQSGEKWGKDYGYLDPEDGIQLYKARWIGVRCFVNDRPHRTAGELLAGVPQAMQQMNSFPQLGTDTDGRMWLLFRHRQQRTRQGPGTVWMAYVTSYAAGEWGAPMLVPDSDGLLDNRPRLVRVGDDLLAICNSDGRRHRRPQGVNNNVWMATLPRLGTAPSAPQLVAEEPQRIPRQIRTAEARDIARMRKYRASIGGKTYQLLRGEFHRHTEISGDGGGDGALSAMFRYGIDAAGMDWIGNGDHDNGGGREYTWWLTQKLSDAFHLGPAFVPMFTYERSVRYPDGHRNVMFAKRGIRPLPRLAGDQPNGVSERDTKMLYRMLKQYGGICASHTSGTDMGTDWRDNDPLVEPIVEIFQGCRQSYEAPGAPRANSAEDSKGGFQAAGYVWNALAKGHRLGFQSSSDHVSTHISYAVAYATEPTRRGIFDAFSVRHCYGATDNILMDVRMGEKMMGDEFTTRKAPQLTVHVVGTDAVAQLDIVKDNQVVYSTEPGKAEVDLEWLDTAARAGTSYYYVRVLQENGELGWASPMWITYEG